MRTYVRYPRKREGGRRMETDWLADPDHPLSQNLDVKCTHSLLLCKTLVSVGPILEGDQTLYGADLTLMDSMNTLEFLSMRQPGWARIFLRVHQLGYFLLVVTCCCIYA